MSKRWRSMPTLEMMCFPGCKLLSLCNFMASHWLWTQRVRDQISFQTRRLCLLWWHSSGQLPQDTQVMEWQWILTGHLALWPLSAHRCESAWGSCCPSGFCGTKNELCLLQITFFGFFFTPISILSPTTAVVVAWLGSACTSHVTFTSSDAIRSLSSTLKSDKFQILLT